MHKPNQQEYEYAPSLLYDLLIDAKVIQPSCAENGQQKTKDYYPDQQRQVAVTGKNLAL